MSEANETSTPAPAAVPPSIYPGLKDEELIDIDYFMKVKLRTAKIESAEALPKSKKLVKLQVDLGSLGKRQVLAGIAPYYKPEDLVGRTIVVVANLKPASLMGEQSQGMLLAGSTDDNAVLHLVTPSGELPSGSTVR
jgi:methionyl-tRNA synthetase